MRVFMTGGNGFIGSVVTCALVARGYEVRCLLRSTSQTERIDGLPVERVFGDVREPGSLRAGMVGCDAVIHLASLSSWNDIQSPLLQEVVVGGTRHVLEAANAAGGLRTVYVSSSVAVNATHVPVVQNEDSPMTLRLERYPYARAKVAAEALCRAAAGRGLPVVIVNPGEVYGPNDTALITAGNLVDFATSYPVLACSGGTSVAHVEDVANGILAALERGRPGQRYILGGENLTVRQLAQLTLARLGQDKPILVLPNALVRALAAVGTTLRLPLPFNPAVIPYATRYWFMDNAKARTELGVSFRSAAEAVGSALRWLCESGRIT
jgi:dihydroflavonol-4-reductase